MHINIKDKDLVFNVNKDSKGKLQCLPVKILKQGCMGDCSDCKSKWISILKGLATV